MTIAAVACRAISYAAAPGSGPWTFVVQGALLGILLKPLLSWRLLREARATPSPNGGWPMGMLALVLDVRLSKRDRYVLHAAGRQAQAHDLQRGLDIAARAIWWCVALAAAAPPLIHPHP
jgi:adenosylcobinamide-phosphate synthase